MSNVRVACGAHSIEIDAAVLAQLLPKFAIADVLEVLVTRDKEGAFKASVAFAGLATSEEVKAMLDRGEMPRLLGVVSEPSPLTPVEAEKPCCDKPCDCEKPALSLVPDVGV